MAAAIAYPVRAPQWRLSYNGAAIQADISGMVLSITYTDNVGHAADGIEVEIEDRERRWQNAWYPSFGDRIALDIGYSGESLLPCGDFQTDETEFTGPPDVMRLRCISAYITPAMRTRNERGYENLSLPQIAAVVAAKYGLTVVGAPAALNTVFARVTQRQETDLGFLRRLAEEHDYDFSIRGSTLTFFSRKTLQEKDPVYTVTRDQALGWDLKNTTQRTYKAASVRYQDPRTKTLHTATVGDDRGVPTGDTLKLTTRVENAQQARARAEAELRRRNKLYVQGNVRLPGTTLLVAGNNVSLSGWGKFDGKYQIVHSRHKLARSAGYTTEIDLLAVP